MSSIFKTIKEAKEGLGKYILKNLNTTQRENVIYEITSEEFKKYLDSFSNIFADFYDEIKGYKHKFNTKSFGIYIISPLFETKKSYLKIVKSLLPHAKIYNVDNIIYLPEPEFKEEVAIIENLFKSNETEILKSEAIEKFLNKLKRGFELKFENYLIILKDKTKGKIDLVSFFELYEKNLFHYFLKIREGYIILFPSKKEILEFNVQISNYLLKLFGFREEEIEEYKQKTKQILKHFF